MVAAIVRQFWVTDQARAARDELERALDSAGWPWSRRLSRWLDALVLIGEARP